MSVDHTITVFSLNPPADSALVILPTAESSACAIAQKMCRLTSPMSLHAGLSR